MLKFADYIEEQLKLTLKYHDKLNPKLWKNDQFNPQYAAEILALSYKFADFCKMPKKQIKDIVITGGNVNYNYTNQSDIDSHIVCDTTGFTKDQLLELKREWSNTHDDKIAGYPVELFCANINDSIPKGQGVYSIKDMKWIIIPKHLESIDVLNDPYVHSKIEHRIIQAKHLIKNGTLAEIEKFKEKLRMGRGDGLGTVGEYSIGNILFKELRNRGLLNKLSDKAKELV